MLSNIKKKLGLESDYFIRSTVYSNHYIAVMKETKTTIGYGLKSGAVGACIFKKENAEAFIQPSGYTGLELIKVEEVLTKL
jgi:hypothetical protein